MTTEVKRNLRGKLSPNMKRILSSKSYHCIMRRIGLILVIFFLSLILHNLIPNPSAFAQVDNTTAMITLNNITNSEVLFNGTTIMRNTSGLIDDAIYALKESFRSFFGK